MNTHSQPPAYIPRADNGRPLHVLQSGEPASGPIPPAAGQAAHKAPRGVVRILETDDENTRELHDDSGAFCSMVADLAPFAQRACNSHAALVAALENLSKQITRTENYDGLSNAVKEALLQADAALASAQS